MKFCVNCGSEILDDAEICVDCGVNQQSLPVGQHDKRRQDQKYCTTCGELINKQAEICPECGVRQNDPNKKTTSGNSNQTTAGILALLFGGIGAHKFYQGNNGLGLIYLCFSWTFIPLVIGLIEGILILTADKIEYEQKYANGSLFGRL